MRLPMTAGVGFRMRPITLRSLAAVFLAALVSLVHAQVPCDKWVTGGIMSTIAATQAASCQAFAPLFATSQSNYDITILRSYVEGTQCRTEYTQVAKGCTTGCSSQTLTDSRIQQQTPSTCTACDSKQGASTTQNFTEGWAISATPNKDDYVIVSPAPPSGGCDGQCAFSLGSVQSCWRSQQPASNGLHRLSCSYTGTYTGSTCSVQTPESDPTKPVPPCPGHLGSVNGKPVCVGTSPNSPLPAASAPPRTMPDGYGNPPAGTKPSTGPGSGEGSNATPTSGDGGNSGGGSSAATPGGGSSGTGSTGETPDIEVCGLPGKAACKMDETGTPNGQGAMDVATGALGTAAQGAIDGVNSAGSASGKDTSWGFSFSLPSGCAPYELAALEFVVDVCRWQGMVHDLMSLLWAAVTFWACVGMVGRTVGGGS